MIDIELGFSYKCEQLFSALSSAWNLDSCHTKMSL